MNFNIINHFTKEIEVYYNAEEMVMRIVELTSATGYRPTHLAVDENGMTIIVHKESEE